MTQSITSSSGGRAGITDRQKKQYLRLIENAAKNALKEIGFNRNDIQKLIENGQMKQYLRCIEKATKKTLKEIDLDKYEMQNLIKNGDEFQARISTGIKELSVYAPTRS